MPGADGDKGSSMELKKHVVEESKERYGIDEDQG